MKITKYLHSCLVFEKNSSRILFDPGLFTFVEKKVKPSEFKDIQAIFVTHNHPDHIDDDSLEEILEHNEKAVVYANSEIAAKLSEKDIPAQIFESGRRSVGEFTLEAFDAPHEAILSDSLPQNTAYTIDDQILHPGDSLSKNLYPLKDIKVLCLPVTAPWETELQTFEFAKRIAPQTVIPVHDGYVKDFFLQSRYENFKKFLKRENIDFQWMNAVGDYYEF